MPVETIQLITTGTTGVLLVIVTFMLYRATQELAKSADRQTTYLARQEERDMQRDTPQVAITMATHHLTVDGIHKSFNGFNVTNVGTPSVTITSAEFLPAVPDDDSASMIWFADIRPIREYQGVALSTEFTFPHKLQHRGDSMRILFDTDALKSRLTRNQTVKPSVQDSEGNTYEGHWIDFTEQNTTSIVERPRPGFREPTISRRHRLDRSQDQT